MLIKRFLVLVSMTYRRSMKSRIMIIVKNKFLGIKEMESVFTAIFEKVEGWYIGYVEELPGANTQGKTLEEIRENLHEAIELILLSNRELAEKNFPNGIKVYFH